MPVTGDACDRWELHLLVRQHCVRRLFKDAPERFIKIHHSLAKVLSQRGETVSAARHAIQAGKTALAGEILEDAGVADVRLRQGLDQFIAADRLLNEKIMSNHPRLRFFHSLGWALSGRLGLARENYSVAESMLETHADDGDLALDGYIVRNDIALCGGERVGRGWIQKMRADLQRLGEEAKLDSFTLGHLQFRLAAGHQLAANFDAARDQAVQAREKLDKDDYAHAFIDLEIGQVDMAQGRAEDAERRYSSARQANLKAFAVTRQAKANAKILLEELALECNRLAVRPNLQGAPRVLAMTARSFSTHAAAIAIAIAMALRHNGAAIALSAVGILMEFFRDVAGSPPLVRYISAQKVFLLVMAGQVEDAAREWRLSDLPEEPSECLDLSGQSWREMEALSCARLRLLAASRQFDQARDFAADLRRLTAECGLRRTLMRALSQSVALERQAGDDNAAMKQLERFLKLFGETRYALPMAWDYQINAPVVKAYVDTVTDSPAKEDALSLLAAMRTSRLSDRPLMNTRELQVLDYLGTHQDKEIARILGLSPFGVRYHIRKIFAKLGACTRADADRRARELGLLVGRVENER